MSAGVKFLNSDYPTGQIVFFRSCFALIPLLLWLQWQGDLINSVRTQNIKGHVLRGVIGSLGMFAGFTALHYLPLSDAIAIGYAAPLFTIVLAFFLLKEDVRLYRWVAVGIGFIGVLLMLAPHLELSAAIKNDPMIGAMLSLTGALCAAGATIQVRRLTATEKTGAIVLYFSLLSAALGGLTCLFTWKTPDVHDVLVLVFIGLTGGIGQILMTSSYRYADASLIAPFEYTTMIWALSIGWLAFHQWPEPVVLSGAAIVMLAGLYVIWREHQLGIQRRKEAEALSQRAT